MDVGYNGAPLDDRLVRVDPWACRPGGHTTLHLPVSPLQWPELPSALPLWPTPYLITVKNPPHKPSGKSGLQIDGQVIPLGEGTLKDGPYVELHDDGQLHHVVVTM